MNAIPEFRSRTRASYQERLLERYIQSLGLCSVLVGASHQQKPSKIGYNAEVVGRDRGENFIVWQREWCRSAKDAHAIVVEVLQRLEPHRVGIPENGWVDVDTHTAHRTLLDVAAALGVRLTTNQSVQERGKEFLERVSQKIFSMQRSGDLREVNKAFKAHRVALQKSGQKMPNYQEFLDEYLHETFQLIARDVLGSTA